ncbi:hypothetical protein ACFVUY_11385 [Kitasatospora sp. NPDC058063]|uniref:hypothetical protein n=1 Tax=unclassified Kitasatospora TaxID=2633591 RepID=UPI0036DBFE8E
MDGQWELICHHSYIGQPGIISDYSPQGHSHGVAHGMTAGDFHRDGAAPGSGAVALNDLASFIEIHPTDAWATLDAVKVEFLLRLDPGPDPLWVTLMKCDSFEILMTEECRLQAVFSPGAAYQVGLEVEDPDLFPHEKWTTLGFHYDGSGRTRIVIDDRTVAEKFDAAGIGPLRPPAQPIIIGGGMGEGYGGALKGLIDDIKVWRPDPDRNINQFFSRPVDGKTLTCLRSYVRRFEEALERHPDCVQLLQGAVTDGIERMRREALSKDPATRERLRQLAEAYQSSWRANDIDSAAFTQILVDLSALLQSVGVVAGPQLRQVHDSECMKIVRSEIGLPTCDPELTALMASLSSLPGDLHRGDDSDAS